MVLSHFWFSFLSRILSLCIDFKKCCVFQWPLRYFLTIAPNGEFIMILFHLDLYLSILSSFLLRRKFVPKTQHLFRGPLGIRHIFHHLMSESKVSLKGRHWSRGESFGRKMSLDFHRRQTLIEYNYNIVFLNMSLNDGAFIEHQL